MQFDNVIIVLIQAGKRPWSVGQSRIQTFLSDGMITIPLTRNAGI